MIKNLISADIRLKKSAEILKAMGHPSRIFIIETIADEKHCVCEITKMLNVDISTVSRHLSVLKNAGIISDEKRGNTVYYSLKAKCVLQFLTCINTMLFTQAETQISAVNGKSKSSASKIQKG